MSDEPANETGVRGALVSDAKGIHALACELADAVGDRHPDIAALKERLAELLEETRAGVFVAEDGEGEISGAVSYWIKSDLAHGDTVVEIPMLVVAQKARRNGVGRMLMDEIRDLAAQRGAALVELVATRQNETAREFYRSLGFIEADLVALEFVGDLQEPPEAEE
ncbi:MAG: GNAT family N-acetyltransferase [Rubrobacter sp.]|nr:GNAT family N-acetyltransferase [Rubrobacter sp.]